MPEVSVIIVCMNRMDNLYPCLKSIRENTSVTYEILVVAYLFSKENLLRAKSDFPDVTFIESDELRGFSENNNLALHRARGRYCFVLNDDTEFSGPVIDTLVEDFGHLDEKAAIVAPKLVNADGSLQLCGRPDYPARNYVLQQWHLYLEPTDNGKGLFRTFNISGAAFLIKTEVFRKLGWFDERYFFTPEDIALSTLCRRRGYEVWCDSDVCVTHKWRTTASLLSPAIRPASIRGSLIFFSDGKPLKYFFLGLAVWSAEFVKMLKARLQGRDFEYRTFRNNCHAVFTRRSPKELFLRYR